VAQFGGESRRDKVWGHLVTGIWLGAWAWMALVLDESKVLVLVLGLK
jgi:hypothetical protein